MASYPPVESVRRALELLAALNEQKLSSIQQLHRRTGLPKATLVRLLQTLVGAGFVANDRRQGGYQVTSRVHALSCGFHGDPLVIEAARAWALDLTRRLRWPVSIATLEHDQVAVRFNTNADSAISPFHATVGMRLGLVTRALGRAYLAFCPADERRILIDMLQQSDRPEDAAAADRASLLRMMAAIRHRGHAERDPGVEPRNSGTIAVPLLRGGRVLATLGLTYYTSALRTVRMREALAAELRVAAGRIVQNVAELENYSAVRNGPE